MANMQLIIRFERNNEASRVAMQLLGSIPWELFVVFFFQSTFAANECRRVSMYVLTA